MTLLLTGFNEEATANISNPLMAAVTGVLMTSRWQKAFPAPVLNELQRLRECLDVQHLPERHSNFLGRHAPR